MRLHAFTKTPTMPIEVTERSISDLTDAMQYTGFQGRKLAESVKAWENMFREDGVTIFMGLSGAMVPAGMRNIITYLIEKRLIDCLVSTGANIFHDCHEALGLKHYVGSHTANDCELLGHGIDRIYDVFAYEEEFRNTDHMVADFARKHHGKTYSSREFIRLLGKEISEKGNNNSIIVSAYKHNVPIFIPALSDSSIGIGLTIARRKGYNINIDQIKDVDEITKMVEASEKTGVVYVGGGVPKNFIQQTEVVASIMGHDVAGHEYAIQYTTDAPQWGGLSGCTFDEAVSWGKISREAKKVQVFVDATIALPIVTHALKEKTNDHKRKVPCFDWNSDGIEMRFETR